MGLRMPFVAKGIFFAGSGRRRASVTMYQDEEEGYEVQFGY